MKRILIATVALAALTVAANAYREEDHYDWIKAEMPSSAFGEWCQMPPPKFKSEWDVRYYDQRPVCGTGNRLNIKQDGFAWSGEQQGSCKIVGVDRQRWKPELYGEEKADPTRAEMYRVNCVGAGEFRFMEVPARSDLGPNMTHVIVVYFRPYPALATPERKK